MQNNNIITENNTKEVKLTNGVILQYNETGEFITPTQQALASSIRIPPPPQAPSRHRQKLTIDALLGQANLLTARNQTADATAILYEIIRQEPRHPDAYIHLSEIFEDSDVTKAFEYRLLGCLISQRTSAHDWELAGDMALHLDRLDDAAACFAKASQKEPKSWTYYARRIQVYQRLGKETMAMKVQLLAAQNVACDENENGFEWLQEIITQTSQHFLALEDESTLIQALRVLVQRSKEYGKDFSRQIRVLLKMYFEFNNFEHAAKAILGFCDGIKALDADGNTVYQILGDYSIKPFPFNTEVYLFEISDDFPTYMLCQLIVCFLKLEMLSPARLLLDNLRCRTFDETFLEVYISIAASLYTINAIDDGIKFTNSLLTEAPHFSAIWFYQGCFYQKAHDAEKALEAYGRTLELDPEHIDARVNTSSIFQDQGNTESALAVLQDYDIDSCTHIPNEKILMQQVDIYWQQRNKKQYIRVLRMLLVPYFYEVLESQKLIMLLKNRPKKSFNGIVKTKAFEILKGTGLESLVKRLGSAASLNGRTQSLTTQQQYDYVLKLVDALYKSNKFPEMLQVISFAILRSNILQVNFDFMENLLILACCKAQSLPLYFEILRENINRIHPALEGNDMAEKLKLKRMFLSMGYVMAQYQTSTVQKFFQRLHKKYSTDIHLKMICANNALTSGWYKFAWSQYCEVLKKRPDDVLVNFLAAICFLNMSSKRGTSARKALAIRALTFLGKYRNLRLRTGPKQEVYYNIGRLFHGMGFPTQAAYWYEKVLAEEDPIIMTEDERTGDKQMESGVKYSLKPLAALNYIEIVKYENPGKARQLRRTYCII